MKIRLGYACISNVLNKSMHTLSYKNYLKFGNKKLDSVIRKNFEELEKILKYNIDNNIKFYRISSDFIPLISHPDINYDFFNQYKDLYEKIGKIINDNNLRVDIHLSNYYVLNSIKENVSNSTINILKLYQKMYEYMKIDSIIIMHIGSSVYGKEEGIKRFINNFNKLDSKVKRIIAIENDDKSYNIVDTLKVSEELNIPIVLDYHHYKVNNDCIDIKDYIIRIFNTWNCTPKVHISSSRDNKNIRSHNNYINYLDFINLVNDIKFTKRDFDVMIEAKQKDLALFRLIFQIKCKKTYKILKNEIFLT